MENSLVSTFCLFNLLIVQEMAMDIKLNYLQWARGQVKDKINSYYVLGYDKNPERMGPKENRLVVESSDEENMDGGAEE